MTKQRKYTIHSCVCLALICFTATVLSQPSMVQDGGIAALFLAVLLTVILCLLETYITEFAVSRIKRRPQNALARVTLIALLLPLILTATVSFFELLGFICAEVLPQSSRWIMGILLGFVVVFVVSGSNSAVFKLTLVSGVVCALATAIILLMSLKYIKIAPIVSGDFKWKGFLKYALGLVGKFCVPLFSAVIFIIATRADINKKQAAFSAFAGSICAAIIVLQSVFTFGAVQTDLLNYPYTQAVGVISTGSLFSRLDGIVYMTVFLSYIIKITVSIKAVQLTAKLLVNKKD